MSFYKLPENERNMNLCELRFMWYLKRLEEHNQSIKDISPEHIMEELGFSQNIYTRTLLALEGKGLFSM